MPVHEGAHEPGSPAHNQPPASTPAKEPPTWPSVALLAHWCSHSPRLCTATISPSTPNLNRFPSPCAVRPRFSHDHYCSGSLEVARCSARAGVDVAVVGPKPAVQLACASAGGVCVCVCVLGAPRGSERTCGVLFPTEKISGHGDALVEEIHTKADERSRRGVIGKLEGTFVSECQVNSTLWGKKKTSGSDETRLCRKHARLASRVEMHFTWPCPRHALTDTARAFAWVHKGMTRRTRRSRSRPRTKTGSTTQRETSSLRLTTQSTRATT